MSDLLKSLLRAKDGLEVLASRSQSQSEQVADYVRQAVIKLSAAIQQAQMEERRGKESD